LLGSPVQLYWSCKRRFFHSYFKICFDIYGTAHPKIYYHLLNTDSTSSDHNTKIRSIQLSRLPCHAVWQQPHVSEELLPSFLFDLFFDPDDGGAMLLQQLGQSYNHKENTFTVTNMRIPNQT
jgi:hypothetical protein